MPKLYFEVDGDEPCPIDFGGPSDVLVYFLSFVFSTRYGSQHDLSKLALMLRAERKIDMAPLSKFADRNIEVDADAKELERAWQDAAPLAKTLREINEAIDSGDERITALVVDPPDLRVRLVDLQRMAEWAAEHGRRVRMTYDL